MQYEAEKRLIKKRQITWNILNNVMFVVLAGMAAIFFANIYMSLKRTEEITTNMLINLTSHTMFSCQKQCETYTSCSQFLSGNSIIDSDITALTLPEIDWISELDVAINERTILYERICINGKILHILIGNVTLENLVLFQPGNIISTPIPTPTPTPTPTPIVTPTPTGK